MDQCADCDPVIGIMSRVSYGAVVSSEKDLGHQKFWWPFSLHTQPSHALRIHNSMAQLSAQKPVKLSLALPDVLRRKCNDDGHHDD